MNREATDLMVQQHIELSDSWIEDEVLFVQGAKRDVEDCERRLALAWERVRVGTAYLHEVVRQYNGWRQENGLDPIVISKLISTVEVETNGERDCKAQS